MGVEDHLADDHPSARLHDTRQLPERRVLVGNLSEGDREVGAVEAVVLEDQLLGVALPRCDVRDPALAGRPRHVVQHLLLDVEDLEPAAVEALRHRQRVVAGARADLEQALARARLEDLDEPGLADPRVRQLDEQPLPVRHGGWVAAPPQGRTQAEARGDKRSSSDSHPRQCANRLPAPCA